MIRRVEVAPNLLLWACERVGWTSEDAASRFPRFEEWIASDVERRTGPTFKQLERFAQATHTPVGYLFLTSPPVERIPIPDCRTVADAAIRRPSPDMLDTIYVCQQRQAWYREHATTHGARPLSFVGSATLNDDHSTVATRISAELGLEIAARARMPTWSDALRAFVSRAEAVGVLVMVSGIVGTNTRRVLDPQEFRGFALVDDLAPVVFVNGADSKAAQMFTLAHELAHVWLGESALSNVGPEQEPTAEIERWCNAVAAELLVPGADLVDAYDSARLAEVQVSGLARRFKVSTLVILRRLLEVGLLSRDEMWSLYRAELERLAALDVNRSGGNFYLSQAARVSRRFAEAIYVSVWEGQASFTDAMRLLHIRKIDTFRELGSRLGLDIAMAGGTA